LYTASLQPFYLQAEEVRDADATVRTRRGALQLYVNVS